MKRLWSPWRSNYIESFRSGKKSVECVFCDALKIPFDSNESLVVFKNDLCYVMLNLYPYNSGHLMVIPYRHVCQMCSLSETEMNVMMKAVQMSIKVLEFTMKPQGFNFGANFGKAAGAGIDDHIHFHVVPRWTGDTNFMPALGDVKIISQDLLTTKKKLIEVFNDVAKNNRT